MAANSKLTALVFGGSGAVGLEIIKALSECPQFNYVTVILRQEIVLPQEESYSKFHQYFINSSGFASKIERELWQILEQRYFDAVFYAIGAGHENAEFKSVDYELGVKIFTALKTSANCPKQIHLISSIYASKTPKFHVDYLKAKAEIEDFVQGLKFPVTVIYRPGGILATDGKSGMLSENQQLIGKWLDYFRIFHIDAHVLGKAVINNAIIQYRSSNEKSQTIVQICEHSFIKKLGK